MATLFARSYIRAPIKKEVVLQKEREVLKHLVGSRELSSNSKNFIDERDLS
jgi:hypothetical protein